VSRLAARALADARARWGRAWNRLGPEQRREAYALAALDVLAAQDDSVPADTLRALIEDLHATAYGDLP
jgi:hypothetical protein